MDTTKIITKIKYGNTELPLKTLNLQSKTITPTKDVQYILPDTAYAGLSDVQVEAIPEDYIQPSGELLITENNQSYDVKNYESAKVEILETTPENLDAELNEQDTLLAELENSVDALPQRPVDRLQWKCDNMKTLGREFYGYTGESLDNVLIGLDTSKVTNMSELFASNSNLKTVPQLDTSSLIECNNMFYYCFRLTSVPYINTSKVQNLANMFARCQALTSIPQLDTSNATSMGSTFSTCLLITEIPLLDTSNVTTMFCTFQHCYELVTIPLLNMIKVTNTNSMFQNCYKLTNLTLKNIKVTLQIGSGTSWGHLLTDESLINTAKELWDLTGSTSQTLTVSTPSNARFDAIYVKLITATAEQIAEDQYINNKKPCVVCESTDEGAMTLREYVVSKNWALA